MPKWVLEKVTRLYYEEVRASVRKGGGGALEMNQKQSSALLGCAWSWSWFLSSLGLRLVAMHRGLLTGTGHALALERGGG